MINIDKEQEIKKHLQEISELDMFTNGVLTIDGLLGQFVGTAKTKLKIICKEHGNGWEWENPWMPTIAYLKRLGGCPKCAGNYRYSAEERVEQLKQLKGIMFDSFVDDYKGNTTRVKMYCPTHQYSWVSSIANLLKGNGCAKCSGVYKYTESERVEQINNLPNVQFISFPNGYKSGKSKALVRCLKDGYEWEVSVSGLINKGRGCHRCSGSIKITEPMVLKSISKSDGINFVSFPNSFINSNSQVELNCAQCNISWELAAKSALNSPIKCPTCSDVKRIKTEEQALYLLSQLKGIKFLYFTEKFINQSSYVMLACEKANHKFKVKLRSALSLNGCKVCNGKYVYTEEEQIKRLQDLDNIKFIQFIDDYKDSHSRARVECLKDGYIWESTVNRLVNKGAGCPQCAGNLKIEESVVKERLNGYDNFEFIDFPESYLNQKSKVTIKCNMHGITWSSSLETALKGMTGCKICRANKVSEKRRKPKEEVVAFIEALDNVIFHGFDGEYINGLSKVKLECAIDGNKWSPTIDNVFSGRKCPKCSKVYKYSMEERIQQLNEIKNVEFISFVEGKAHAKSRVRMRCTIDEFVWETTIESLLKGSGCPKCASNSWDFRQTIKNPYTWEFPRFLYYIQFKHTPSGDVFWKIGLNKSENINERYTAWALKQDQLEIESYKFIELDNYSATLTEFYTLREYSSEQYNRQNIMVETKGGTECFGKDILENISLEFLVAKALEHKQELEAEVRKIIM